jgi:hypothetical protein
MRVSHTGFGTPPFVTIALSHRSHCLNGWAAAGFWDGVAVIAGAGKPGLDGQLNFACGGFGGVAEGRAEAEVGDVGDPAGVLGWPEEVGVVSRCRFSHRGSILLLPPSCTTWRSRLRFRSRLLRKGRQIV